jgi:hypothetical protein
MRVVVAIAVINLGCAPTVAPTLAIGVASPRLEVALSDTGNLRVYYAGEVDKPVAAVAGNQPPKILGLPDGEVSGRFVVDTIGRAEVETLEIFRGSVPELAAATRSVLPSWRFYPAVLATGHRVRQLVALRVVKHGNGADTRVDPASRR